MRRLVLGKWYFCYVSRDGQLYDTHDWIVDISVYVVVSLMCVLIGGVSCNIRTGQRCVTSS